MRDADRHYEQHCGMIREQAWSFAKRTGCEFDELFAQGNLIYCQALRTFDSSRNIKFSTWLYIQLRGRLGDYVKEIRDPRTVPIGPENEPAIPATQARAHALSASLSRLSSEAQEVARLLLSSPLELFGPEATRPKRMLIRKFLRDRNMSCKASTIMRELRAVAYNR